MGASCNEDMCTCMSSKYLCLPTSLFMLLHLNIMNMVSLCLVQAEAEVLLDLLKEFPSQCATLCFTCKVKLTVIYYLLYTCDIVVHHLKALALCFTMIYSNIE